MTSTAATPSTRAGAATSSWSCDRPTSSTRRHLVTDRLLAVLRPAWLPAGSRRHRAQRQHARDVRRCGPRDPQTGTGRRVRADRPCADARVPDGHPRSAERTRQDPLRPDKTPGQYKEITILDISDFHAQLVPLAEAADNCWDGGLEPDLRHRRVGVPEAVVRRLPRRGAEWLDQSPAATRSGATPPISAFFGDTPTIELMNLMGIDADAIGNHNFDKGAGVPPQTLIPLADVPVCPPTSSTPDGTTPPEWKPRPSSTSTAASSASSASRRRRRRLSSSRAFDPFHVDPSCPRFRPRSTSLRRRA